MKNIFQLFIFLFLSIGLLSSAYSKMILPENFSKEKKRKSSGKMQKKSPRKEQRKRQALETPSHIKLKNSSHIKTVSLYFPAKAMADVDLSKPSFIYDPRRKGPLSKREETSTSYINETRTDMGGDEVAYYAALEATKKHWGSLIHGRQDSMIKRKSQDTLMAPFPEHITKAWTAAKKPKIVKPTKRNKKNKTHGKLVFDEVIYGLHWVNETHAQAMVLCNATLYDKDGNVLWTIKGLNGKSKTILEINRCAAYRGFLDDAYNEALANTAKNLVTLSSR